MQGNWTRRWSSRRNGSWQIAHGPNASLSKQSKSDLQCEFQCFWFKQAYMRTSPAGLAEFRRGERVKYLRPWVQYFNSLQTEAENAMHGSTAWTQQTYVIFLHRGRNPSRSIWEFFALYLNTISCSKCKTEGRRISVILEYHWLQSSKYISKNKTESSEIHVSSMPKE